MTELPRVVPGIAVPRIRPLKPVRAPSREKKRKQEDARTPGQEEADVPPSATSEGVAEEISPESSPDEIPSGTRINLKV